MQGFFKNSSRMNVNAKITALQIVPGEKSQKVVFQPAGNAILFVCADDACGNGFQKRANYRIYTKDGMITPQFDFDDGGFRGWGTIIPVELGSRTRYFWLTFDRHNGSDFPWSYGNWYCFEAI